MKNSLSVAVGHVRSEDGCAAVLLYLDDNRAALTPSAARKIAMQLFTWADHAESWKAQPEEDRVRHWQRFTDEPTQACEWVVKVEEKIDG